MNTMSDVDPSATGGVLRPLTLLVDDSPDIRRTIGRFLEVAGFEVVQASKTASAAGGTARLTDAPPHPGPAPLHGHSPANDRGSRGPAGPTPSHILTHHCPAPRVRCSTRIGSPPSVTPGFEDSSRRRHAPGEGWPLKVVVCHALWRFLLKEATADPHYGNLSRGAKPTM
jgi:hypothetical protein